MFYPEITDDNFNEKLYLKKEFRDVTIRDKQNISRAGDFKLSEIQTFLRNYISPDTPYNGVLVYHGVGSGKCLLKGTPILLYNGEIKNVEKIKEGDILMGDDSTPRTVLSLAKGIDKMYTIVQHNNDNYTVNSEHILCLKANNYPLYLNKKNKIEVKWIENNDFHAKTFYKSNINYINESNDYYNYILNNKSSNSNILEISIKDYLLLPNNLKKILKGYRVPIELPYKETEMDPYIIGNRIDINLSNISSDYIINSSTVRNNLLAGIVDKYGKLIIEYDNINIPIYYELFYNNNNKKLIKNIKYLVKSLGLNIINNKSHLLIYGNGIQNIPVKNDNNKIKIEDYNLINKKSLEYNIKVKYLKKDNYYGFTLDGNCRFLLGDCTVTHNTCTAISIAEGFKRTLKCMNKKILVLTYLKKNFQKELFDFEKEKYKSNPEDIKQCTGREYELGEDSKYLTLAQKEKEVSRLIKNYYQFFGYGEFAHYIINRTNGWKGEEEDMTDKIKAFIANEFNDRVIIIDEIQNIKTDKNKELSKSIQPLLQNIIKYGKNIKLVLMSATPMFDRPDEIIFYINLLLENDGRPIINKNDIFNYIDGTLKPEAEDLLRKIFTGYVSFMRSEKPYDFPFRIYPKNSTVPHYNYYIDGNKISDKKTLKYTKLILCEMKGIQENTYTYYLNKKISNGELKKAIKNENNEENNEDEEKTENNNAKNKKHKKDNKETRVLHDLINISNITFPIDHNNNSKDEYGSFSKYAIDTDVDNGMGGYYKTISMVGSKKKIQYKYQSHAIFNKDTAIEAPFADEKHLYKYSTKFASILETIRKSKGLIFIFSNFIEQGVLPLALILEQNGFDRECIEGEDQLLDYHANKLRGGGKRKQVCYLCGNEAKHIDHNDEKCKNYHIFKRAKYMLYFVESKDIIKIKKNEALNKFINPKNKYGEEVKIFIGTRAVSEGLDFKRLRQVHILEPWYNLSRHEQIIGRAIRFHSHDLLLPEEKNVEIFQYASILPTKNKYSNRESIDLKNYRIAENKDLIIKKISRIMKESAVDCVYMKDINVINSNKKEKQITSSGDVIYVNIADKPYSPLCDYEGKCEYKCNWEPNPRIKYPVNTDTYNIYFAQNDILNIKKHIKLMFKDNLVYYMKLIEDNILSKFKDVNKLFIYIALQDLVNNKNEIIYDKFGRKGYIIYKGDYYIFQPLDLDRTELPLMYRTNPSNIKPEYVNLDNIEYNYTKNNVNNNNKTEDDMNNNIFFNNTIETINILYKKYLYFGSSNKKAFIQSIIGHLLEYMNNKKLIEFIKILMTKYINDPDENIYIKDIITYLNKRDKLINYYSDIQFEKTKINNEIYVGFIIDNQYYILQSVEKTKDIKQIKKDIKFVECTKDIVLKIKAYRNITKKQNIQLSKDINFNIIYGTIEYTPKDKKFKIIDKSVENSVLTKEKKKSIRSIITGRTCSTYQSSKLMELRDLIGLPKSDSKKKIEYICQEIEIFLRFNQIIGKNNKIWFIEK